MKLMKKLTVVIIAFMLIGNSFAQVLPVGNYVITLADGGKALDADGPGMNTNGGKVHLWDNNAGTTQVWSIKSVGGNSYSIVLVATGKALDADGPGMYTDGGVVHLWDKRNDGYKTQSWKITWAGNNAYNIVLNDGGKAFDAGISSMYQNDGMVHLWSYNGGKTQKWVFKPAVSNTDPTTTISNLTTMSDADFALWNKAKNNQQGIIGNDFRGFEDIGSASFERQIDTKSECFNSLPTSVKDALTKYFITPAVYLVDLFGGGISSIDFWYPQHQTSYQPTNLEYYKRTLSGTLDKAHFADEPCIYLDEDLNIDVTPSAGYDYLTKEGHPVNDNAKAKVSGQSCPSSFTSVEAEIALRSEAKDPFLRLLSTRFTLPICLYGPWIYDDGHCDQPEIHPAEQIWWTETNGGIKYNCSVFCDASKRFLWRDQMDNGLKLKPWGAPPVRGTFAIAIDVPLDQNEKFEVSHVTDYNVIEYPNADQTYKLNYQGKTLVTFIPHNDAFKVSFEKIGLVPGSNNRLGGFLVIETYVGTVTQIATNIQTSSNGFNTNVSFPPGTDPNKIDQRYERQVFRKVEGHYIFSVSETLTKIKNFQTGIDSIKVNRTQLINH
jgi:hypothetical protein